jgi:hypothetical protein
MAPIATTVIGIRTAIAMGTADSSLSFTVGVNKERHYAREDRFYNVPKAAEEALSGME